MIMRKIKIQIKSIENGSVLFEHKKKDNTIKDTLMEALKQNADIRGADLRGADIHGADLHGADLYGVNLSDANLCSACLSGASVYYAKLFGANLCEADLYGANLCGANLRGANLCEADLYGANLCEADLYGANLDGAKHIPYIPIACPFDGAFIGWKKVVDKLVKLEIPEDARRSSATTAKCRCDKARVLAITDIDGNNPIDEIVNAHYAWTLYKVGEIVYPDSFDEDRWKECSHGIHFFINKQDAINY